MDAINSLEKKLDELFVKQMPALPKGFKDWVVKYLPWINVVLGVISLMLALSFWQMAHQINQATDWVNRINDAYGTGQQVAGLGLFFYLALIVLIIEALIYIAAFPGTRDKKKSGWNLLFYALLINVVYGFLRMFTDYGDVLSFVSTIIGSAIGGYFLFQIRASYSKAAPARSHSATKARSTGKKK